MMKKEEFCPPFAYFTAENPVAATLAAATLGAAVPAAFQREYGCEVMVPALKSTVISTFSCSQA